MEIFNKIKDHAIRYGLILGVVSIVISMVSYAINYQLMIKWWFGLIALGMLITVLIIACRDYRKKNNDLASFAELFVMVIVIVSISSVLSTVGSLLLFKVIDPELGGKLNTAIIDQTAEMMEGFGTPDDVIDKTITEMEGKDNYSTGKLLMTSVWGIVFGGILGLIFAAIFKKNPPEMI